jgi:hypothetical protein
MNTSEGAMLLPKTKNPTESHKVNTVVSTICHPVYLISALVTEVCSMELTKNLLILVILERHDV